MRGFIKCLWENLLRYERHRSASSPHREPSERRLVEWLAAVCVRPLESERFEALEPQLRPVKGRLHLCAREALRPPLDGLVRIARQHQ